MRGREGRRREGTRQEARGLGEAACARGAREEAVRYAVRARMRAWKWSRPRGVAASSGVPMEKRLSSTVGLPRKVKSIWFDARERVPVHCGRSQM